MFTPALYMPARRRGTALATLGSDAESHLWMRRRTGLTWLGGMVAAPLGHGGNSLDELAWLGLPLLIFLVVWIFTRRVDDESGPQGPPSEE